MGKLAPFDKKLILLGNFMKTKDNALNFAVSESLVGNVARRAIKVQSPNKFEELAKYSNADDMEPESHREALVLLYRGRARKLAMSIMKRWRARVEREEFESTVDLSLCEAAKLFKPGIGCSFTSYLFYHLRGNLIRSIQRSSQNTWISRELARFMAGGVGPEIDRPAGIEVTAEQITKALSNHEVEMPEEALYRKQVAEVIREACQSLEKLQRSVIGSWLMGNHKVKSIAESVGLSRCYTSRIRRRAMRELKKRVGAGLLNELDIELNFDDDGSSDSESPKRQRDLERLKLKRKMERRLQRYQAKQRAVSDDTFADETLS